MIVPSLPGFPGGDRGHWVLDTHMDWVLAARDILTRAGLDGADLAASSVGGALAAEIAAIWPASVPRLALIAPFGLFDAADPPTDPWAQRADGLPALLCADPEVYARLKTTPEEANSVEWPIEQSRAAEASARLLWPLGSTKLEKRLPRITAPTLLLRGARDRIMPQSAIARFAKLIAAPTEIRAIVDAGHLAELDQPRTVAEAILSWTE